MLEIERKFLVNSLVFKEVATKQTRIVQAYLNSHPERSVRVRIKAGKGILTVKGKGNETGMSRFEWENEISVKDAENLLPLCEPGSIDKIRYEIPIGNHCYEVDEFFGENKGLIVAEVELKSETEIFEKPIWLGKEVTGQKKYYNSSLVKLPFTRW